MDNTWQRYRTMHTPYVSRLRLNAKQRQALNLIENIAIAGMVMAYSLQELQRLYAQRQQLMQAPRRHDDSG